MNSWWEIFGVEWEKSDRWRIYGLRFDIDWETVVVVADVWWYKNHPDLVDPVTMPLGAALDPRPSRKDWENGVVNTTRSPATIAVMESLWDMEEYVATQPQQILNKEALATEPKLPRELADRLTQAWWEVWDKPSTEESRWRVVALVWDDYYDQTVVLKIEVRWAWEDGQKRVEIGTLPIESALEPSHSEEG